MRPMEFWRQQYEEDTVSQWHIYIYATMSYPRAWLYDSVTMVLQQYVLPHTTARVMGDLAKQPDLRTLGDPVCSHAGCRGIVVDGSVLLDGIGIAVHDQDLDTTTIGVEKGIHGLVGWD